MNSTSQLSARTLVPLRRFPWLRSLALDYADRFEAVAPFYAGDPARPEAWGAAIARTLSASRDRSAIVQALARQQERREAPPAARAALQKLADPRGVAIVTGQQAGVFGGPVFTLLKALTAIQLAERTERDHGVPAVPVFWIDAEDHDWDEVASCTVLDAHDQPVPVTLPKLPNAGQTSVAGVQLSDAITASLQTLAATLPPTPFTAEIVAALGTAYRPGIGMAEAFGRWLEWVLGSQGLVVYDASDATTKPLVAHVFVHELSHVGVTAALATAAGEQLAALGYHAQVASATDGVALFHLEPARAHIRRHDAQFQIDDRIVARGTLLDEAAAHPERFSPNVLLRPIVQDTLFPTVCYVAGPSELAYLGQLRDIYAHFGVPMPLFVPRATATIVPPAVARFLARYDVPLETLRPQDESALNRLLESQLPPSVEASLEAASRAVQERLQAIIEAVPAIDPTLVGAARSTLGRMEHDLQTLQSKIIHAAKKRHDTLRRQFSRAQALTFPNGHPQEREIGFVHFLNLYGPALVDALKQELPLELGSHVLVSL